MPRYSDAFSNERKDIKSNSAKCGHVKRRLLRNERLSGKTLEFALGVVGEDSDLADKLRTGQPLSDYELHWMVDVILLHKRLSG
jgi:hypothetical protein